MSDDSTALADPQILKINVTVEETSTCQRKVKVSVPREEIDRYYEEAVGDLMPTALLPGFRPGRAPRKLVGSKFKSELNDQIRSKLLNDALARVNEQENLAPISEPDLDVAAVILPDDGPMTFEFSIEVRPEFEMPEWKGLSIERPMREISDADVEEAEANLLRERGRLVPAKGSPKTGDLIVANLKCTDGENNVLSHAEEMEIVVRPKLSLADAELEGFDKLVSKLGPGQTVTAEVSISEEAAVDELRGKKATLSIEILDVKRFEMPEITPSLLTDLGDFKSTEDLREAIRKQLQNQLEWHQRKQVRQQVSASLTASASWDLPPELLRRQSQRELERSILELRRSGFDDDSIRRYVNELRQSVMASTARSLKEHFILEKIAEAENVSESAADYDAEIKAIAAQSGESPRRVRASLERKGLMDVLRNQIIERKTIDLVTSKAEFKDIPFEFPKPDAEAIDHAVCGVAAGEDEIPTTPVAHEDIPS